LPPRGRRRRPGKSPSGKRAASIYSDLLAATGGSVEVGRNALQQPAAFVLQAVQQELYHARRLLVEIVPGMAAAARAGVELVRDAQRLHLLVQPIVAAQPPAIVRIDAEKDVRRKVGGVQVQEGRVLPALLLAVVERIERRAEAVEFVAIEGR